MKVGVNTDVNQSARAFWVITFLCDAETLQRVFTKLGFKMVVRKNLTAEAIHCELQKLAKRNFANEDALVRARKNISLHLEFKKTVLTHIG